MTHKDIHRSRSRRTAMLRAVAAAWLLLFAVSVQAGIDTVLAKGFNPNIAYQINEFDSVNTLTGELMLDVPLGPTYKTNGSLSYSFGLHYTPDFWSYIDYSGINVSTPPYETRLVDFDGVGWRPYTLFVIGLDPPSGDTYLGSEAVPVGNAGVGWFVAVERFAADPSTEWYRAGTYTDSRGAAHVFTPSMHATPPVCSTRFDPQCSGPMFTHDGSYLRMRLVDDNPLIREVDLPDGTVKHFECVARCNTTNAMWNLKWTADPFGNVLLIERTPEAKPQSGTWIWNYIEATVPNSESRPNPYYRASDHGDLRTIRRHTLTFQIDRYSDLLPSTGERLLKAELAGPDGDSTMLFTFDYGANMDIFRTTVRPWTGTGLIYPFNNADKTISVKVLRSITLPANAGKWQFEYNRGDEDPINAPIYTFCSDFTAPSDNCPVNARYPTSKLAGRVSKARTPAGGGFSYAYGGRTLTTRPCGPTAGGAQNFAGGSFLGVRERRQLDENGAAIAGNVWRYSGTGYFRAFIDDNGEDVDGDGIPDGDGWDDADLNQSGGWEIGEPLLCRSPNEYLAATLEPNGKLTINYYNLEFGGDWFAAPFTPNLHRSNIVTRRDGSTERRYLSTQIYQADVAATSPFVTGLSDAVRRMFRDYRRADPPTSATLLRSSFATYQASAVECDVGVPGGDCQQYNLRVGSEHVRFHDDPATTPVTRNDGVIVNEPTYIETLNSDFDGLGHFRQRNILGNFRAASKGHPTAADWDHRIEYQLFNPAVSWAPPQRNPSGIPAASEPWLISNYTHTSDLEASRAITTRYHFDSKRGYLRARRKIKQSTSTGGLPMPPNSARAILATEGADDFLAVFTRRNEGDDDVVIREENYGGDNGHLGAWQIDNDEVVIPANAERDYAIDTTYRFGTEAKTEYLACDTDNVYLQAAAAEIDAASGLATTTTDFSGLSTAYAYDTLGRVTSVTPPGGLVAQTYTYTVRTSGAANLLTIDRSGGASMTYAFDGQGRLKHTSHVMPAGTSTTTYTYTSMGKVDTEILPTGGPGTIRHEYDVFDRETKRTGADGKFADTTYKGDRESVTTRHGVALDSGSVARVTKNYDIHGRLTEVNDDVTHGAYEYDPQFKLTKATLNAEGDSHDQDRFFDYDGRGVLKSITHPEFREAAPATGQVVVKYKVDARGHVTDTDYSWVTPAGKPDLSRWSLRSEFDKAERLRTVSNRTQLLQEFQFNSKDDAAGKRNRLASGTRHNFVSDPASTDGTRLIDVTTSYVYQFCDTPTGCTGQVKSAATSASTQAANNAAMAAFFGATVGYAYDSLGDLERIDYPVAGIADAPARAIHFSHDHQYLTAVREGAGAGVQRASLTYHLNGQPNVVQLSAPNVSDTFVADLSGMPRPRSITWKWAGNQSDSGLYVYDGAGNISAIGPDRFKYDKGLRLVSATVADRSETYEYDGFGNRTKFNGASTGVDWHSNRLQTPVRYDEIGNVIEMPDTRIFNNPPASPKVTFVFDALSKMIKMDGEGIGRVFVYDVDNERIGVIDYKAVGGRRELWSVRDQENHVLRDFERTFPGSGAPVWHWKEDYVYRGAVLCNTIVPGGVRDIHVDHLGSIRFVTDAAGHLLAGASTSGVRYMPFGGLAFNRALDERMAFTGHERDDDGTTDGSADIDYMHARYYSSAAGRFLSADMIDSSNPARPQSWNRYVYAMDRPMNLVDPNGLAVTGFSFVESGPNAVQHPGVPATLGVENNKFGGFHYNFDVKITFDPGDDLSHYSIERDALIHAAPANESRTGKAEDPDDPGHVARTGGSIFVSDGPGLFKTDSGIKQPSARLGSGTYQSVYELRVVDVSKSPHQYDPKRFYYGLTIQYKNGQIVTQILKELTEAEYRAIVPDVKTKPHL